MSKKLVIAVDFDGTIVRNKWPEIGSFRFGAKMVLRWMQQRGHILILNTCRECNKQLYITRSECPLCSAQTTLKSKGIYFDYYNENAAHLIKQFADCRKIGADLYLDDKAFFPGWWIVPIAVLWLEWRKK